MGTASRICRVCGKSFVPTNPRQMDCREEITRICPICGNEFKALCSKNSNSVTCSKTCMNKLASRNRQLSYAKSTKICEWCGKEFHPISNTAKYCEGPHYFNCVVCGRPFEIDPANPDKRKTCSSECLSKWKSENNPFKDVEVREKIERTMMKKYGVKRPCQNKEISDKQHRTMLERYGVEYFSQSEQYKEACMKTYREKYGCDWGMQSSEIQEKSKQTTMKHYHVSNPMHSNEIKERMKANYLEKTGYEWPLANPEVIEKSKKYYQENYGVDHVSQTDECKEKVRQTSMQRYGVPNPLQNPEIKAKMERTTLAKYGSTCYFSSPIGMKHTRDRLKRIYGEDHIAKTAYWKKKILKNCNNLDEWLAFTHDPEGYIKSHFQSKPTYKQLGDTIGVDISTVSGFICMRKLNNLIQKCASYMEADLSSFLDSLGVEYDMHDRHIIKPYELDFLIPSAKVGIECNPTSTHNSTIAAFDNAEPTPYKYHQHKTELTEQQGYFVLHLFSSEWKYKRDIMESIIKNLLGVTECRIYARKCVLKEVPWEESVKFLQDNHRQGSAVSKVRLGLYFEDQLVSLMTFGKMRNSIGTGVEDLSDCWELVRFCNKKNTSVVGGASKLFKHFQEEYRLARVRSFSDRAHTRGTLYPTLGFKEVVRSDPGYVWVNVIDDRAYNRVNAQKQNIKKFLKDDDIDLSRTEKEIMIEHGFVQVFDSGTITWEWQSY